MILSGNKIKKLIICLFFILLIFAEIRYFYLSIIKINKIRSETSKVVNAVTENKNQNIEIIADDLDIPWEIVFLPDKDILITERSGYILRIGKNQKKFTINNVETIGEGGLLGMAIHPDYSNNNWIYLYLTSKNGSKTINRIERYRFDGNNFSERKVIVNDIPAGTYHNGGRMLFGPDNFLYITTGDAGNSALAQNKNSLAGKILRVKEDGDIPKDNPFTNAIWSYGHRNPQGLAFDDKGHLWATEHGRSGDFSGFDELNLIEKGGNYGWSIIQGDETRKDMKTPIINSGTNETWAPAGIVYLKNRLFFTGLRGESVYETKILDGKINGSLTSHLKEKFGRLRAIKIGPDGFLYISTSNADGRGKPKTDDDKIIKISPEFLINEK